MKEYYVRKRGETEWTESTYCGFDHYEAAEQFAEEYDEDNDGELSNGGQVVVEMKEEGKDKVYTIILFAEKTVKYDSRDLIGSSNV